LFYFLSGCRPFTGKPAFCARFREVIVQHLSRSVRTNHHELEHRQRKAR
jgi:hypothetical protein